MNPYPHFTDDELDCPCGCGLRMNHEFMDKVEAMRRSAGFPFPVNSGARCKDYDESIGGKGPHRTGRALDIRISGEQAFELLRLATAYGMKGIGVKQHGDWSGRFIHIDDLDSDKRPRIWSYK